VSDLRDRIADKLRDADDEYANTGEGPTANELADAILAMPEISDLQKKLAELEALTDELDFLLNEGGEDSYASLIARAEAAEQRVAELEAELKASKSEAGTVEACSVLAGMEKE